MLDLLEPFDQIKKLELGEPSVSDYGVSVINKVLLDKYGHDLPEYFPREYTTTMGNFPSRVEKLFRDFFDIRIPPSVKEDIGNIASKHTARADSIIYDVTRDIMTWPTGSFGNPGSCFRKSHRNAVAALMEVGGAAFRLFKPGGNWYGHYRGIGRAWLVPYKNHILVFNGYGMDTADYARAISKIVGHGYGEVNDITSSHDLIYFNNGRGYAVGPNPPESVSFSIDWVAREECFSCGKMFNYYRKDRDNVRFNNGFYCFECTQMCDIDKRRYPHNMMVKASGAVVTYRGVSIKLKGWINENHARQLLVACPKCDTLVGKDQEHKCGHESN